MRGLLPSIMIGPGASRLPPFLSQAEGGIRNISPSLDGHFLALLVLDSASLELVMEASQGKCKAAACAAVCWCAWPMGEAAVGSLGLAFVTYVLLSSHMLVHAWTQQLLYDVV